MNENRLGREKSPYLLQHARNPVEWYPWGEEAFSKARAEDKPVLLSIGYSTCHWCHVMAHESFEDAAVADALARTFIAVKVDREERPDIDAVYMQVCQGMTGSGGWPLTIIMAPDQRPFYAGTYLPRKELLTLLGHVEDLWCTDRPRLQQTGEHVAAWLLQLQELECTEEDSVPPVRVLAQTAADWFARRFDARYGGFGVAPKFPSAHNLLFLLRYDSLTEDGHAAHMALRTLEAMYRGGLFDHAGGGFSRYSTDAQWLVPHFEKMLYDNALLALAYTQAFRQKGGAVYRYAAQRTLDYILRDLTGPEGGFLCGQDADSGGAEGRFYVFTPAELRDALHSDAPAFCARYGVTQEGNFEGSSILHLHADEPPVPDQAMRGLLDTLTAYRARRMALHTDDKVLCSWLGLAMAAFARAGWVLATAEYTRAAERAWDFARRRLIAPGGRLWTRYRDGESAIPGTLDDYAFLAYGLLELYAANYSPSCLTEAAALAKWICELFEDAPRGGFYLTAHDAEQLIARPKELTDNAMPCGNSVAAHVFVRLSALTGEAVWREWARRQLDFLARVAAEQPAGHSFALLALCEADEPAPVLVCATRTQPDGALADLVRRHKKELHVLLKNEANAETLAAAAPFTAGYPIPGEGFAYYLCRHGACQAPVTTLRELESLLAAPGETT